MATLIVPEGFTIEEAVPADLLSYPMFASFDEHGRLFVFESTEPNTMGTDSMLHQPTYHIRLLLDTDGDGRFDSSTIFADSIPLPMGGAFYQGSLYTAAPPNLLKLTDVDGDGVAEKREVILTGWTLHANAATLSGPFIGPDGWFYMADARRGFAIQTQDGNTLQGKGARIWRSLPDGSQLESYAGGGFDNAIEIAFTSSGETIGTMTYFTDPQDGQRDALMHWVEGGVYPKPNQVIQDDKLRLSGELMPVMTPLPRVAPSGLMRYKGDGWGAAYKDNLFSAEFNTGRIMRHVLNPYGGTFQTDDEAFITSTSPDTHPTDVLQDADGSLLVVLTGGWFIEGCPLSRVAKPDVRGGIYRIRKLGVYYPDDPRGLSIDWLNLSGGDLVQYLSDPRIAVRERALEILVSRGPDAAQAFEQAMESADEEVRVAAVFGMYRASDSQSISGIVASLKDSSPLVRTAAARVLGLMKETDAVMPLAELLLDEQTAVRRQAATALGQIGDSSAVQDLLEAAAKTNDRFVEHAIINALMVINKPEPLYAALSHASAKVRRAAAIALDQMENGSLEEKYLAAFLSSQDTLLQHTGVWLAAHHPEWGDVVADFIRVKLDEADGHGLVPLERLLVTFIASPQLQELIAAKLLRPEIPSDQKLMLLRTIGVSPQKIFPQSWLNALKALLKDSEGRVQVAALDLIGSRNLSVLSGNLQEIILADHLAEAVRLKALDARLMSDPKLSEKEFELVLRALGPTTESPVRQAAVRSLARAELSDGQLLQLARDYLPSAALFLLPSMVDALQGTSNPEVGEALLAALSSSEERLANLSEQDVLRLFASYPPSVRQRAEPLITALKQRHAERYTKLEHMEKSLGKGDVGEGRKLFFGKAACSTCHAVGLEGGTFGPDLTNIGEIRSRHDLLEAIMYPDASFAREYETYKVLTHDNEYTGIISEQLSDAVILTVGPAPGIRIPRVDIRSLEPHHVSMMPPGLDQQLSQKELEDLIAFLEALPYRIERLVEARER
ncbi:MAG TPA: PVC-type heme-binding CxxCH protein [Cyclobacteriaceae bacterium]|nr:PVC-type heme-binding CxxCH protein [Cyclobacteriaceae bacterium]